ncbi:MAG: translation initiation factor IF-6 [Candidatus Micrarchaeaceae archaeon]
MNAIRYQILGSEYIGVFATVTEKYIFIGNSISQNTKILLSSTLSTTVISTAIGGSDMVGLFMRGNSNGIVLSNLATEREVKALKEILPNVSIGIVDSVINAVGNDILANDKIALVNPDYDKKVQQEISDILDVETIPISAGNFSVIGASNTLTNKGMAINNRVSDREKAIIDKIVGFESMRVTANFGSMGIGLSILANSKGAVVGGNTTGYEFARILEALNIKE